MCISLVLGMDQRAATPQEHVCRQLADRRKCGHIARGNPRGSGKPPHPQHHSTTAAWHDLPVGSQPENTVVTLRRAVLEASVHSGKPEEGKGLTPKRVYDPGQGFHRNHISIKHPRPRPPCSRNQFSSSLLLSIASQNLCAVTVIQSTKTWSTWWQSRNSTESNQGGHNMFHNLTTKSRTATENKTGSRRHSLEVQELSGERNESLMHQCQTLSKK